MATIIEREDRAQDIALELDQIESDLNTLFHNYEGEFPISQLLERHEALCNELNDLNVYICKTDGYYWANEAPCPSHTPSNWEFV